MEMVGAEILYLFHADQWEATVFTDRKTQQFYMFPAAQSHFY